MGHTYRGPSRQQRVARNGRKRWNPSLGSQGMRIGRDLEANVATVLERLVVRGSIDSYEYHEPNSDKDKEGIDFTIIKNGQVREIDVTASSKAWKRKVEQGRTNVLHISIQATTEQIETAILSLFTSSSF